VELVELAVELVELVEFVFELVGMVEFDFELGEIVEVVLLMNLNHLRMTAKVWEYLENIYQIQFYLLLIL